MAGILSSLTQIGSGFEHRLKHDLKGPSYAMRSINNLETCGDDKKRALSCVALKKKGAKIRASSLILGFFLPRPPPPALEEKISKAGKDRGRDRSILFSSRELEDQRSIRNRLRVHLFRWRKGSTNPFGASENPKTKSFYLIHRKNPEEIDKRYNI